jgi:hypothetical protein
MLSNSDLVAMRGKHCGKATDAIAMGRRRTPIEPAPQAERERLLPILSADGFA